MSHVAAHGASALNQDAYTMIEVLEDDIELMTAL